MHAVINFPSFVGSLTGVAYVRYSARYVWVAGVNYTARLKRSELPANPCDWTAFTIADAVAKQDARS